MERNEKAGEFPYTRGIYPNMYKDRIWTIRQYSGYGNAEETNRRYKYLIKNGQTGLSVAFDLPTQIGYDSDNIISAGEVGRVGVAIDSLKDMEILFDGIDLDKFSVSMTINATASIILAMYIAIAEKQNIPLVRLSGTIQNDILKEYLVRGTYIFPIKPSMRIMCDIFKYSLKEIPKFNIISVSGYHIREAGTNAVQEIAFTIANAITYIHEALNKGMKIDDLGKRFSFFFAVHSNFFEEIAKFRVARRLWAKIMKERFDTSEDKSMMMRIHAQTGGATLTIQQPYNNVIRVSLQALSAVCGGIQSLHTNSYDEAIGLPSEESVMLSMRTQQIIANEIGINKVIDPLGGSYYIEKLTDELEEKAEAYIRKIDEMGGAIKAVENGFYLKEIYDSAYKFQCDIEKNKKIIVGINLHNNEVKNKLTTRLYKTNNKEERTQVKKLQRLKRERNNDEVISNLNALKQVARSDKNIMPCIISCVKSYATIGEICNILRDVFGVYEK